jgi:maltooligosyltrehalose trehalohydrolase
MRDDESPNGPHHPRLGAVPTEPGLTELRVWAPNAATVTAAGSRLEPEGDGMFAARLELTAGSDYGVELDGGPPLPDPCSRRQPNGLRGLSRVLDPARFSWTAPPLAPTLRELVVYELHVGTFTAEGTLAAAQTRLHDLAGLGITAVELMPVATFVGARGWGYDGVLTYAPHEAYGGPEGLARFVDAAHREGLAVILDVVYNHVGAGGDLLARYGPYFTDRHETLWGSAIDFDRRGVREWAIQNAEMWVRDYRVDGLRLDATHAIFDDGEPHVMRELADRVHAVRPGALVIAEMAVGDRRPIRDWGHDAQWADEFHHALHVLLTGERDGYYSDYGRVSDLARAYEEVPPERLVFCASNHDQIGNRAFGDRLPPATRRVAAACLLFAPQVPLVFQGDEHGETAPFMFFTDHDDPALAEATREGRRREFARFESFRGAELPDPQAPETFRGSRIHPESGDEELRAFYCAMIALRRTLPLAIDTRVDERRRILRARRGTVELTVDFSRLTAELATDG